MVEIPFNTKVSRDVKYRTDGNWPTGNYVIELTAVDSMGQSVKDLYQFTVTDTKSKVVADNALIIFELDKPSYKVGEVAKLRVGSAAPDITFFIHVEKDHKITRTYEEKFSSNTTMISIPITERERKWIFRDLPWRGIQCVCVQNRLTYPSSQLRKLSKLKPLLLKTNYNPARKRPGASR